MNGLREQSATYSRQSLSIWRMSAGKNKRAPKGKKAAKKVVNPYLKKQWYTLTAPGHFSNRDIGQTLVTRSSGKRHAEDDLMGRIVVANMADLMKDEKYCYRKLKLRVEQIKDRDCLTNFYGLDMTRDRLCQLFRKGMTFVESFVDVKTLDGYSLRVFGVAFTAKAPGQLKRSCRAQSSIAKALRMRMSATIRAKTTDCSMKDLLTRFNEGSIEGEITKQLQQLIGIIRFRQQRPRNAQRLDRLRTFFHLQREGFRRFRLILQHHSAPILPRFSSLLPEPALPYEGEHALSRHMASHLRHALRHRFVRKDFQQHRVSTAYAAVNLPPCLLLRIIYS